MPFEVLDDLVLDASDTSAALGRIAEDEAAFRLLVQSFRAQDREGYYEVLKRFDVVNRCELICDWLCTAHCALVCFELCGPPVAETPELSLRDFGVMIQKLAGSPDLLEAAASAVLEQDRDTFQKLMDELGWGPYCHYICQWICGVRCRLVCRILCDPRPPRFLISCAHLVAELRRSAAAIASLVDNARMVETIEKALIAQDHDTVRDLLQRGGFFARCYYICFYFQVWRCVRACLLVCHGFPFERVVEVLPALHDFARTLPRLTDDPEALRGLVLAMDKGDSGAFEEHIKRLELHRYCHWICFWICRLWFRRFCIWLCPPVRTRPWFTHVGHFHIYGDIDAGTGRTNKLQAGHGGPDYAFFRCLELRGYCPAESPTVSGAPMRYRFLYQLGGSPVPLVGNLLCDVLVGSRKIFWDVNGTGLEETFQSIWVKGSGATPDPTPTPVVPPGTPWGAPPDHVIVPDADGWIAVDQNALGGGFSSALIGFHTPTILPGGDPAAGVLAGAQIPMANLKDGTDLAIIFEATRLAGPVSPPDFANSLARIRVNNWYAVELLDIAQFLVANATSCTPLSNDLDVLYTVDHQEMSAWSVVVNSAGLPATVTLAMGTDTRDGGGNHTAFDSVHQDISTWPTCSYTVSLGWVRKLTTGLVDDSGHTISKTFCIGARGSARRR